MATLQFYPLVENHHRHGILRKTIAPAPALTGDLQGTAETYAQRILEHLEYVGVLALELFQTAGDMLLVNEIAPRVHNSGHFSIEGSRTSQFENHLRAILGLPLGDARPVSPSCMLNLVGTLPRPRSGARGPRRAPAFVRQIASPRPQSGSHHRARQ